MSDSLGKILILVTVILVNFIFLPLITVESRLLDGHFMSVIITHFWMYLKTFYYYGLFTPLGFITLAFLLFSFKEGTKPNHIGARLLVAAPFIGIVLFIHLLLIHFHPWVFGADASEGLVSFYNGIGQSLAADFKSISRANIGEYSGNYTPRFRIVKELESLMAGWMLLTNFIGYLAVSAYMKDQ